jgi:tetratricopeptide (TPR) repeat protein
LTDWKWFEQVCPQQYKEDRTFEYAQFKQPLSGTIFEHHANALSWYRGGLWKQAIACFRHTAELRSSDQAFDWLYIAMSHQQLGEFDEARRWYDKAMETIRETNNTDAELLSLADQAEGMLKPDALEH